MYGEYFAALSKKVRAELAEANSVAEEVLSSMATVKAHAAQVRGAGGEEGRAQETIGLKEVGREKTKEVGAEQHGHGQGACGTGEGGERGGGGEKGSKAGAEQAHAAQVWGGGKGKKGAEGRGK